MVGAQDSELPLSIGTPGGDFLLTIGHRKLEGIEDYRVWHRGTYYQTFVVLLHAEPPYAIAQVSDPVYFDIAPRSYVYPFQLMEIPSTPDRLLASLYIGGRYNEMLTIETRALLNALPDPPGAPPARHG